MRFRVWIASIFPVSASAPALIAISIPHCRPARFDRCERNGQLGSTHIELNALHVRLPTGALPEKLRSHDYVRLLFRLALFQSL